MSSPPGWRGDYHDRTDGQSKGGWLPQAVPAAVLHDMAHEIVVVRALH
ncbi:MAG TPA: hypothetical protein VFE63_16005 [Roseiarcus sp.]|nr:hypothetical protein [Roseiarcus sp.]